MGVEATQFIATPPRLRADIKRSREVAERDKHISDKKRKSWHDLQVRQVFDGKK